MARQTIYTVGGTVQAGGGIYLKRKADDELLQLCRQGEFAFILSSRQVGKSSLMVHTAQELAADNICSVIIDLSALGTSVTPDEWYLGILNEIHSSLNLETDIFGWWQQYSQLGPSQRLTNFFKDVLLKEVKEQVVLFFDEIDSTLTIPFSDDFYVALRAVYNARSTTPDFKRLSFVLVGVAAPSDLISDNRRTPFNIGRRVEIRDFTLAEALPLAQGLGQQAEKVLAWVLQYSGGHPYLTQRLCADLANSKEVINEQTVARTVERLFTGEQGKQDNNLQFVRDMLSKRSPDVERVLSIYKEVRSGKNVVDDERSIAKAHLKLSGLVRSEQGFLRVRNEIYNSVFNLQWIRENTPKNWQRTAVISLSAVLGIFVLLALIVFANDYWIGTKIDHHVKDFYFAKSPRQRLGDLAEIYRRKGILSNKDSALTASELFYGGLSSAEDQLALFDAYGIDRDPVLQNDMIFVISHLYISVANVDPEEDNTQLLEAMLTAVSSIPDNPTAASLKDEITAWIAGRKSFGSGDMEGALSNYNTAYSLNTGNQAILYERAKVYVQRKQYTNALSDLEAAINAAKQSAPDIATPTPTASSLPETGTLPSNTTQPKETGLPQTSAPTQINTTPTGVLTPALQLTPTPTVVAPPTSPSTSPKKYESNFTTLIDVVNAVRTLIENTPQLKIAMQSNGQGGYTNLQSFGLISPVDPSFATTQLSASLQSPDWVLTGGSPSGVEPIGNVQNAAATLSGQRLHVLIQLEDVPDTLTVNRESTGDNVLEYAWEIHVDLDSNGEDDYSIGLFTFKGAGAKSRLVSLTSDVSSWGQVSLSIPDAGGTGGSLQSSGFAVSFNPEKNTLEFIGSRSDFQPQMKLSLSVVANTKESFRGSFINQQFLMLIENASIVSGRGTLVTGRVARGTVKVGDPVMIIDSEDQVTETTVVSLEVSQSSTSQAVLGDDVGILIQGNARGQNSSLVLAKSGSITTYEEACVILSCPNLLTATPAFVQYTIQQGDTLATIAQRFDTSVALIIQANGLSDPNLISVGQTLKIPVTTSPTPAETTSPTESPTEAPADLLDGQGVAMVLVPEGQFSMGSDKSNPDEAPLHSVNLDAYYIDKFEVTNALYQACVNAGPCKPPVQADSFTRSSYYGNAQFDDFPVVFVDWNMANSYCEWRGAQLPTEAQWEKAARGTDGRIFPWGNDMSCSNANVDNCVGDTTAVGSYKTGQSVYGAYDLSGNVWEWVADWYADAYYQNSSSTNPLGPDSGQARVMRGGSWNSGSPTHQSFYRGRSAPAFTSAELGFRCVRSP